MRDRFKDLRLKQLDRALAPFLPAVAVSRPVKGWVRAIREAIGVSSADLARKLGTSRQLVVQQEKAEAEDRITLKSLRTLANALDCDLIYALVPRTGSLDGLMKDRARIEARKSVVRVEHSMALEGQAVGNVDEAIEEETRRLVAKRAGQ
jgi:predicted DNA-binding mobile mystery protein A